MTASPPTAEPRRGAWLWLTGLWAFLLVLAALRPLAVPDEGRYGEVGRWMLQSGDWLTPRLDGLPFFHKPPLLYWLEAGALALFGNHVWALRLVPALHAGAMLAALYLAARRIAGERIARRAALMLGTSVTFLLGGQYVNHDMMVAPWIGLSIWCFAFSFMHGARPHAGLARWGFVAAALGLLSKGLIGAVLPGLVLFLWLLWTRQWKKLLAVPWVSGALLFALIAVPWFVLVWLRYPGAMDYLFGTQQFTLQHIVHHEAFPIAGRIGIAGQHQQGLDQHLQFARGTVDALYRTGAEITQARLVGQHVDRHLDHGERTAQLVAGVAREIALALVVAGDTGGETVQAPRQRGHVGVGAAGEPLRMKGVRIGLVVAPAIDQPGQRPDRAPLVLGRQAGQHRGDQDQHDHGGPWRDVEDAHRADDDQRRELQSEHPCDTAFECSRAECDGACHRAVHYLRRRFTWRCHASWGADATSVSRSARR